MLRSASLSSPQAVALAFAGVAASTLLIPPLRRFTVALATSNQIAARYLAGKLTGLVTGVVGIAGLFRLSTLLAPWVLSAAPPVVQRFAKNDAKIILASAIIVGLYKNFDFPVWQTVLQPIKVSEAPFFGTQVIVQKRQNKWYFMPSADGKTPGLDVQFVVKRAVAFYGMTLSSYIYNSLTIGMLEYPRNIISRIFRHYGGLMPQCNLHTSPENFYRGVMNTSMACWMSAETGNLDFWNLRLTFNDTDTIVIDHIEIFLDHDAQVFVKMEIDGKVETSPEQASIMAQCIFAIYTHPQVHWWANGARQLEGLWPSARESGDVTQWMNMASTYISWIFIGNSAKTMAGIISHNVNNGLPFHFSELHQKVAVNSKAHTMAMEVRKQMAAKYPTWTESQINSLMASTLYHSTDHYYTSYYMSWASQSKYLMQDNSLLRLALFAPNKYYTRRLLCVERQDDPICKLIYEAAVKVDPVFANTALFIGCAN